MTDDTKKLIAKLRYMGRQYAAGGAARGGAPAKHYLEEAADVIEALTKDAQRYRWLKANAVSGSIGFGPMDGWIDTCTDEWDEFIDAIKAKEAGA